VPFADDRSPRLDCSDAHEHRQARPWTARVDFPSPGGRPRPGALRRWLRRIRTFVLLDLGSQVTLTYEQHLGLPSCFGETGYFVRGVRRVGP
jgi:hypothetical protein